MLGEDFAGTAALSLAWASAVHGGRAIAVDTDRDTLFAHAGGPRDHARVERIVGDVRTATEAGVHACDILWVGNFSIGEIHDRADLVGYLAHCRERLVRSGGVFVCDTYGGDTAFVGGDVHRHHPHPTDPSSRIRYTWEQREADPLTGRVVNAMHFRIERAGVVYQELTDAFVYHWRLWSVPELRDAMVEAGFVRTEVFGQLPDAVDDEGNAYLSALDDPADLDDSFIVCVAGRTR